MNVCVCTVMCMQEYVCFYICGLSGSYLLRICCVCICVCAG